MTGSPGRWHGAGRRVRWIAALGAVAMTFLVMLAFLIENRWGYMRPDPVIIFAESWLHERPRKQILLERARDMQAPSAGAQDAPAKAHQ